MSKCYQDPGFSFLFGGTTTLSPRWRRDALRPSLCFVLLGMTAVSGDGLFGESYNPKDWYKRYPVYPPYCSTPFEMSKRAIPPLPVGASSLENLQLMHVTVVVRHGARTPYAGNLNCWENYTVQDTGVWDCHLTTLMAPPSPGAVSQEEGLNRSLPSKYESQFLFEKRYDALQDVPSNLSNELRGTCQVGQLLLQGYEQEITNGQMLRAAYLDSADERMKLKLADNTRPWEDLFYRADDDQRTLMSGQVLLRGLLGKELQRCYDSLSGNVTTCAAPVVVPVHTADRPRDVMDANENVCPRLAELGEEWKASVEYSEFMNSQETRTLQRFVTDVLKVQDMSNLVDCLMTTICTDRTLPKAVNDYHGPDSGVGGGDRGSVGKSTDQHPYGTNLFSRLFDFDAQTWIRLFLYQNAAYSKLALTPLWRDVLANIQGNIDLSRNASAQVCCPVRSPPKLAVYSGHDTTLMPMLASLGSAVYDGEWAPYASMMTIEVYHQHPEDQYLFRLVYNGKVLTSRIDGCDNSDLCPVSALQEVTKFTQNYNCTRRGADPVVTVGSRESTTGDVFSTSGGVLALCLLVVASALFGSLGTYLYVIGRPRRGGRQYLPQEEEEGDISLEFPRHVDTDNRLA